jgi:ferredoxin
LSTAFESIHARNLYVWLVLNVDKCSGGFNATLGISGACEGSLACSTCHVIVEVRDYLTRHESLEILRVLHVALQKRRKLLVRESVCMGKQDPELYAKLPEPTDDENDMLDLAYGLTDTYAYPLLPAS